MNSSGYTQAFPIGMREDAPVRTIRASPGHLTPVTRRARALERRPAALTVRVVQRKSVVTTHPVARVPTGTGFWIGCGNVRALLFYS